MTFPDQQIAWANQLAALRQRATKGPWKESGHQVVGAPTNTGNREIGRPVIAGFGWKCMSEEGESNRRLTILLANHSEAIEKVVRAAEFMLEHAPQVVVSSGEGTSYYVNDVLRAALNELEGKG